MHDVPLPKLFPARLTCVMGCVLIALLAAALSAPLHAATPGVSTSAVAAAPAAQPVPAVAETAHGSVVDEVDVRTRLEQVYDEAELRVLRLLANLPLLLAAALIVFLASWIGGFISQRLHWLRLRTRNPYLDGLIRRAVRAVILLIGFLVALDLLNATALVGAMLGSAGVLGLALGFAFKDIAENYIAGILLSLRRPFEPGELVRIDSYEGKVAALSARAMTLITLEGNELRLPNALVFKAVILNYTSNPKRRFDFTFSIDASQSIRKAHAIAMEEIASIADVLTDPAPSWTVVEFGASGSVLRFFGWVDQRHSDLGKTRSEAIRLVKGAFWREGIQGPKTTTHVVLAKDEATATPALADQEPATSAGVDTSVNRDIDRQVAEVQSTDERNLLTLKDAT
ncbi:mechanosensitive ion channel family protein [Luteimonas sp. 3794]|uniref:mechanosensitive ion channel family protein n=1 Tax=Luteimonas sp. 3794 TaxID=2817730 RepID=UPI00285D2F5A|nr:mechanosensitive ion channel family protein [Luteimonas sp. 3794]MDR6992591.1 small-conductance mechanosensitive channel [Luteimonas sp. 3794]